MFLIESFAAEEIKTALEKKEKENKEKQNGFVADKKKLLQSRVSILNWQNYLRGLNFEL